MILFVFVMINLLTWRDIFRHLLLPNLALLINLIKNFFKKLYALQEKNIIIYDYHTFFKINKLQKGPSIWS